MRYFLPFLFAAALAAQTAAQADDAPKVRGFEYAQLWFGDTYTVGIGINARQYTRAVICFYQETGCRFSAIEVQRQIVDYDARIFIKFLDQEGIARAAALLGKEGWKLVSTAQDQQQRLTLMFRRKMP
ncbi:MAG: hypothetical protein U0Q16_26395 [Bryobacteraceae bacterium]